MTCSKSLFFYCHVYHRGYAEPCIDTFFAQTRDECLSLAQELVLSYKEPMSDAQYSNAAEAWDGGAKSFELDEDGFSLSFGQIEIGVESKLSLTH